jgi:hypothetical protein
VSPSHRDQQQQAGTSKSKSKSKPSEDVSVGEELGGSIPIPKELQRQLAAQAKKESAAAGGTGGGEVTYFIPLQVIFLCPM